jgi:broad specificity phosphatase PhoE
MLAEYGLLPDVVHTSLLRRAIHTSQLALDACDRHWIPVNRSWRLNERHYGALQGKDKKDIYRCHLLLIIPEPEFKQFIAEKKEEIPLAEFEKKLIPFIIARPLPNKGVEYWKIQDLEIL